MAFKLGVNAKLYFLSTGTRATWNATVTDGAHVGAAPSSLTEISTVKDLSIPIEAGEVNLTTRQNGGWEATEAGVFKASMEIPLIYDPANAGVAALMKAYLTRGHVALAVLDGDKATDGTQGLWADFSVLKMDKGEEIENAQMVTFTVKPGLSAVAPEWVKVAAA
jgi:hypothetical protein